LILAKFPAIFSQRLFMAQSTEFGSSTLPKAPAGVAEGSRGRIWRKVKRGILHTVFWSYERGTWQYDLIVIAILSFIFLSPRAWFNDRPTLEFIDLRHQQGFVELGHGKEGWRFLVDARLVESYSNSKPEDAIRAILSRQLRQPFNVISVVPITDKNNVVLGYTVLLNR